MRDFLPTAHFDTAFAVDDEWWRVHGDAVEIAWRRTGWRHIDRPAPPGLNGGAAATGF